MKKLLYTPGNYADKMKRNNLLFAASEIKPKFYVELHAGCGYYKDYDWCGSPYYVKKHLESLNVDTTYILCEKDEDRLKLLKQHVSGPSVNYFNNHILFIRKWLKTPMENSLVVFDPQRLEEYIGGLTQWAATFLFKKCNVFLFIPIKLGSLSHTVQYSKLLEGLECVNYITKLESHSVTDKWEYRNLWLKGI